MQRFAFIRDRDEDRVIVIQLFLKSLGYQVVKGEPACGMTSYLLDTWERHVVFLGPNIDMSFLTVAMRMPELQRHAYIIMTTHEKFLPELTMNVFATLQIFMAPLPLDFPIMLTTIAAAEGN